MKALIVFDSVFGNTEKIARSIGAAIAEKGETSVVGVNQATPEQVEGIDLLVVGSPTRAFRPTPATGTFITSLPADCLAGVGVAAFDTRISVEDTNSGFLRFMINLFGYAAKPIADKLVKKGGKLIVPPEGFWVGDSQGPLKDGELERAALWAAKLMESTR